MVLVKVKEAYKNDVGRGIVRIGSNIMKSLDLTSGDAILIEGKKKAVALVWGAMNDEDDTIRMDGTLRYNSGSSIDDDVSIKKIEIESAKEVQLSPLQQIEFSDDFIDYVHERIVNLPLMVNNSIVITVLGKQLQLVVSKLNPDPSRIVWDTKLKISKKPVVGVTQTKGIRYEDIGGLKQEIEAIREMIEIPMKNPDLFRKLGINPPKGVLLYGPPGTGKTLLARAVASETDAHFITLNGPEIINKYYGQSEENLRNVFKEAQENAPAIIFIDEVDAIAPNRDEVNGELERRVVSQLLTLMDGLEARGDIIVIAATNRPDSIDPALRRPGRFDRELHIGIPNVSARREILSIHARNIPIDYDLSKMNLISALKSYKSFDFKDVILDVEKMNKDSDILKYVDKSKHKTEIYDAVKSYLLDEISEITVGYSGADLEVLVKEAAMRSLKKLMPELKRTDGKLSKDMLDRLKVSKDNFMDAFKFVEPSAMREVSVEIPKVNYKDIGGLEDVKSVIRESAEWPLIHANLFEQAGISPTKGVLLYGPPGTGKTLLAKAVANETRANFILIKGPELLSKWVGESEKGIRKIFSRAKQVSPAVIFFDEIDALVPARGSSFDSGNTDKLVAQLLTELDGVVKLKDVLIMASTNRPELIDPALLRPGRFDKLIFIDVPDKESRLSIFKVHTSTMKIDKGVKLSMLADKTEGYTGADIEAVCREAGMISIRSAILSNSSNIDPVKQEDFDSALDKIKPSVSSEERDRWQDIEKKMSRIVR